MYNYFRSFLILNNQITSSVRVWLYSFFLFCNWLGTILLRILVPNYSVDTGMQSKTGIPPKPTSVKKNES